MAITKSSKACPWLKEILAPARVQCNISLTSIKKVHEHLAELFAHTMPGLSSNEIFEALWARERLGSTGLGHGVGLPHCRQEKVSKPFGALITLKTGIPYDAPDNQPVDILFALLLPEEPLDENLEILSKIAECLKDPEVTDLLRNTNQADVLLQAIW